MLYYPQHVITSRYTHSRKRSASVVKLKGGDLVTIAQVFAKHGVRPTGVYLLNGYSRVLSIRPEYLDHNNREHDGLVMYRVLVWNEARKFSEFVDLAPGMMVKVVGS